MLYAITQWAWAELMKFLIEAFESSSSNNRSNLAIFIILIFFFRGVGSFLGQYGISHVSRHVVRDLRHTLFLHLMHLPQSFFHRESSGKTISKVTYNIEQVAGASSDAFKILVQEGLTVLVLLSYLIYSNWQLSLLFFLAAPIIAWVVVVASKRLRALSEKIQHSMGDVSHITSEAVQGFQTIKSYGAESQLVDQFQHASENNCKQSMKLAITNALSVPLVQFLVGIQLALLVAIAFYLGTHLETKASEFMAYLTAAALMTKPLRQLTQVNAVLQNGIAAATSVFSILDLPQEVDEGNINREIKGHVEFDKVRFTYPGETKPTLKDISFSVEPGQTIALVGKTGSGKTTLVDLISCFNRPDSGQVLIDGVSNQAYNLQYLRENIAFVSQAPRLFAISVRDNIAFGQLSKKTDEEIWDAARTAHADQFINQMPAKLDQVLAEDGMQLSGGQRQRLAIARAVLKQAPILILDEATSALDNESEKLVQASLSKLMSNCTTFVVAHRLSTVERADQIIVLDQGQILEQGTHGSLLKKDGAYAALYRAGFGTAEA